jgi:hypothetical protein
MSGFRKKEGQDWVEEAMRSVSTGEMLSNE